MLKKCLYFSKLSTKLVVVVKKVKIWSNLIKHVFTLIKITMSFVIPQLYIYYATLDINNQCHIVCIYFSWNKITNYKLDWQRAMLHMFIHGFTYSDTIYRATLTKLYTWDYENNLLNLNSKLNQNNEVLSFDAIFFI